MIRSFAIAYFVIPTSYYAVNAVFHVLPGTGAERHPQLYILVLNAMLLLTAGVTFVIACSFPKAIAIRMPLAGAAGGIVGVLHWFPLYAAIVAARLISASPEDVASLFKTASLGLLDFWFPIYAFSGSGADGSLPALVATPFLLLGIGAVMQRTRAR